MATGVAIGCDFRISKSAVISIHPCGQRDIYLLRYRIEFEMPLTNSKCRLRFRKLNSKTRIESIM
ncbi:hypothetical protein BDFB_003515 [Asbolus verrucosus]|uniref:Uncharacterized protein n=1 Tax=Asbolus verrucosus TaxID=1661398 RepID=A0A482VH23_ASBVE|nr:hypothetical protein BDFB_003515 [Asbolus verrucosus]